MPDSVRRAIRTFVQAFTGTFITLWLTADHTTRSDELWVPDRDFLQRVLISALISGGIALVTFLHNWSEDVGALPAVLKATPSGGENPVTRDPAK